MTGRQRRSGRSAQLVASGDPRYLGIVGLVTDLLRLQRRRGNAVGDGRANLFVAGAIMSQPGRTCWSIDDATQGVAGARPALELTGRA